MNVHTYNVLVIGSGGSGLYTALEASYGAKVAVISKLFPNRSHTGAAQGGVAASFANLDPDNPDWHAYDTIKGGDYLVDQNAAEILTYEAVEVITQLENWGMPFSRTEDGKIAQRKFGGHTQDYGKAAVRRACFAADRTGHVLLQTLYQQCIKNEVKFFNEFHVVDVIMEGDTCKGVITYELKTREIHIFYAQATVFATGGFARMFKTTSNAYCNTGDGPAVLARAGIPMMDMEMFQFHPTGLYPTGILVTEGARGEGGILRNKDGEEFMKRYSPTLLNLAPRDIVSRSIVQESRAGRGVRGDKKDDDYVYLDLTHLGKEILEEKLPDISSFCRSYVGVEPSKSPIPISPTAHYSMGGIPSNTEGQVWLGNGKTKYKGLYAVGECSCISAHGANRLGSNSLLEIVVFGKRCGREVANYVKGSQLGSLPKNPHEIFQGFLNKLESDKPKAQIGDLYHRLQDLMMNNVGVYRNEKSMLYAIEEIKNLKDIFDNDVRLGDLSKNSNTNLANVFELRNLLDLAYLTAVSAENRKESRGGHSREDYPDRDDQNYLKHTLSKLEEDNTVTLDYREVVIFWNKYPPKARTY